MMTESQAIKKGCPLFCVVAALAAQVKSFEFQNKTPGNCQGSECMMWQWGATKIDGSPAGNPPEGYCGLAR